MIGIRERYAPGERKQQDYYTKSANIITIAAKTAMPIVSSVPKCRNSKASRSHPLDTIHGSATREQQPLLVLPPEQLYRQQEPAGSRSNARRQGRGKLAENQVLLIVQDDHIKGGGIPVVGRRLASKSISQEQEDGLHNYSRDPIPVLLINPQPEAMLYATEAAAQPPPLPPPPPPPPSQSLRNGPVLGRRTHRMLREQFTSGLLRQAPAGLFEGQQVYYLEQGHLLQQDARSKYSHNNSKRPLVEYSLPAMNSQGRPRRPPQQTGSSCSSLCSPDSQLSCAQCFQQNSPLFLAQSSGELDRLRCCPVLASEDRNSSRKMQQCACCPIPSSEQKRRNQKQRLSSAGQADLAKQRQQHNLQMPYQMMMISQSEPEANGNRHLLRSSSASRNRKQRAQKAVEAEEEGEASAVVSQMYESLAAELKAKLGNPNIGPILLPPKDYDTISRKQGKLTGIELRRSTNPQLVGPASSRQTNLPQSTRVETNNKVVQDEEYSPRSRSNSSSGLGSISTGRGGGVDGSPTNSKSSSNEDMRSDQREPEMVGDSRKICSPDNCSSSGDSGHSSGSGRRLDSRLSSGGEEKQSSEVEENNRKCEARGRGIHLYNPSKVSDGVLWNGRVEIPLKVNRHKSDGNTYLATKQIIY